jgi:ATP-dependent helicase/DNAse subunit B
MGEIQRAGKSPAEFAEIVQNRMQDTSENGSKRNLPTNGSLSDPSREHSRVLHPQIDFDQDVALVYSTYANLLEQNKLTEDDADGLSAIQILRGDFDGPASLPWLENVQLLVLDGFFDFTPAQGEILRLLIPQIPEVLVNLNKDDRNPEIFSPSTKPLVSFVQLLTLRSNTAL